eukprot:14841365-Ditylum_brightwellii.AAC.1
MRTAPSTKHASNPDVKRAVITLTRPTPKTLKHSQYHTYRLLTTPADTDSPTYKLAIPFLTKECPKSGSSSGAGYRQCSKARM